MTAADERESPRGSALERCISVSRARFAGEYWGARPLLSRAAELGEHFGDLFSLAAADELIADRALRTPFVRMATEGSLLAASRYTGGSGFGAEVADQLDPDRVLAEFADGATLVLQGLHRTWPALRDFTRELVAELGHPAQVNAYITPAASRGFDPHYDVHDVLVIQIHGSKHWTIHRPVLDDPLRSQPWVDRTEAVAARAAEEPVIDETFSPGDVLYLPRGWIHSATALGGTSVHLTIGIPAMTRWDLVEQLVEQLRDDAVLRASLPLGIGDLGADELEAIVGETAAAMAVRLAGAAQDASAVGEQLARRLAASSRPEAVRPLATVERLARLSATDTVRWRRGLRADLSTDERAVHVRLRTATVAIPLEAHDAVLALAAGEPVRIDSFPGLDVASSLTVARRLIRESVLVLE